MDGNGKFSVRYSRTINLGNYNSEQIELTREFDERTPVYHIIKVGVSGPNDDAEGTILVWYTPVSTIPAGWALHGDPPPDQYLEAFKAVRAEVAIMAAEAVQQRASKTGGS